MGPSPGGGQLAVVSATVRTQGSFALDTFLVTRASDGQILTADECDSLQKSVIKLLRTVDVLPTEDDDDPALSAGDAASRASYALQSEQWEIAPEALKVQEDRCLGKGTFGECYTASWRGTPVAVKRLRLGVVSHAAALELFRREMAVCVHLVHPNIVQFLGAITTQEPLCIVTELMTGGSLADKLDGRPRGYPYPLHIALPWLQDCARGMRYLHERRPAMIIHRDLKPANLLFDAAGRLKITDFGLSKSAIQPLPAQQHAAGDTPPPSPPACHVVSRANCGSFLYTAPEVCRGEPYTARVDVFAYAMILYEVLFGELPFEGLPAQQATHALVAGSRPEVRAARGVSREVVALLQRCWDAVPSSRPSFAAITDVLDSAAAAIGPAPEEVGQSSTPQETPMTAAPPPPAAEGGRHTSSIWAMVLHGARVALTGVRMAAPPSPPSPLLRPLRPVLTTATTPLPPAPPAPGSPLSPAGIPPGTPPPGSAARPPRLPTPIPKGTPLAGRSPLAPRSPGASPHSPGGMVQIMPMPATPAALEPAQPVMDVDSPSLRRGLWLEAHNLCAAVPLPSDDADLR